MLTALRLPDRLKYIAEWLKAFRRPAGLKPAGLKYVSEWLRTISAGACLLGLISPDLVGADVWRAVLVIGLPTGVLGFWMAGKVGDR